MDAKRYIGIDLHRDCFTACLRLENGREYLKEWKLEELAKFTAKLRPSDEVAVEVTGNTRLFHDAVAPHVGRIVAVNPSQFKVITHSVKKTDPNDARNLALYLAKDLLPEVRMKDKTQAQIASLTQTRDTMVKLRTALKNKVNNLCSAHGVNLNKESLASEKGLRMVLEMRFDPLVNLELKIIIDQIRSLNQSIAELEETIGKEGQNVRLAAKLTSWRIDIHSEEQWAELVEQRAEEEQEHEQVAAMAEIAAEETGVELTPEMLAQDEDLIRKLQELQRAGDDDELENAEASEET